jgi:hypothetical protein
MLNYYLNLLDKKLVPTRNSPVVNYYNNIINRDIRDKLMSSRVMKRNPVHDDIIDNLYITLDNIDFLFRSENYAICIVQIELFLASLKNKDFINVKYDSYLEDERFIKISADGIRTHYLSETDFNLFLQSAKKYNYTITDIYKETYELYVKCLINIEDYKKALEAITDHIIDFNKCFEYKWLKLYSIILYFINKSESIKICRKLMDIIDVNDKELYFSNIILMIKSLKEVNPIGGKEFIKSIIQHYNITYFSYKEIYVDLNKELISIYNILGKSKKAEKLQNILNVYL